MNEKDHETYREGIEKYASETLGLEGEARDNFTDLVDSVTAFAAYGRREADEDTTKEASEETPLDRYLQKMAADGDGNGSDDGDDIPMMDRLVSKATDFVAKHPMAVGGLLGAGTGGTAAWALGKNPLIGAVPGGLAGGYYGSLYAPGGVYGPSMEEARTEGMTPVERAEYYVDKADKRLQRVSGTDEEQAAREALQTEREVLEAMRNGRTTVDLNEHEPGGGSPHSVLMRSLRGAGNLASYVGPRAWQGAKNVWFWDTDNMWEGIKDTASDDWRVLNE